MLNTEKYRFEKMVVFAVDDPEAFRKFISPGMPIAEGVGFADGKEEPIFITDWVSMSIIGMLGFIKDQKYVMILSGQAPHSGGLRTAIKTDIDGIDTPLGQLRMMPEAEARSGAAWSQFDGNYWVASGAEELLVVSACRFVGNAEERAEGRTTASVTGRASDFDVAGRQPAVSDASNLVETLRNVFGNENVAVLDSAEAVDAFFDNAELGSRDPHLGGTRILSTGCAGSYGNTTAIPDPHAPAVGVDPASVDPMQNAVDQRLAAIELDVAALRTLVDLLEKVIKVTHYGAYHQAKHSSLSVG